MLMKGVVGLMFMKGVDGLMFMKGEVGLMFMKVRVWRAVTTSFPISGLVSENSQIRRWS
jgi:hypothetical protein